MRFNFAKIPAYITGYVWFLETDILGQTKYM